MSTSHSISVHDGEGNELPGKIQLEETAASAKQRLEWNYGVGVL